VLTGLILAAAALCTRLAFLWASPDRQWPHAVCYEGDATLWVRYAWHLQRGLPFEWDLPIHTPAMGYLLRWAGGAEVKHGFAGYKTAWCILSAASCLLTWLLAQQVMSADRRRDQAAPRRVASVAALLAAGSFGLTVQATSLNNEVPYTFLLLLISLLTIRMSRRCTLAGVSLLGLLHGVAVLFRAEHTLVFIALGIYLVWQWKCTRQVVVVADRKAAVAGAACTRNTCAWSWRQTAVRTTVLVVMFLLVTLPWNLRSYHAIQRFNTAPQEASVAVGPVAWTSDAVAFLDRLPAFARQGNFRRLSDLALAAGRDRVTREFVESWFLDEQGYIPRALSPWVFVSSQGPLCFALGNNALADGGFTTSLLNVDGPGTLALGNPRHLRVFQEGYRLGWRYLTGDPRGAVRLWSRKLAIFGNGLTQGLTPLNLPLRASGIRRAADQLSTPAGNRWLWPAVLYLSAAIGLLTCLRRREGTLLIIVLSYKLVVTLLFFGYVRQAVSVLPFFLVLVALGFDVVALGPMIRRWPRLAPWAARLAAGLVVAVVAVSAYCGWRAVHYEVYGGIDHAPEWGTGAFESHQALAIRLELGAQQ